MHYTNTTHFDDLYNYRGRIIGAGIFARDKTTHDPLVIKILSIKAYIANSGANTDLSEVQYERNLNFLKNETEMNANFNHPSIMKVKNRSDAIKRAKWSLADYMKSMEE